MKVGRLQNCRYHGLSASACIGLRNRLVDAAADLVHLLKVGDLGTQHDLFHVEVRRSLPRFINEIPMRRAMSVQPSATRSSLKFWPVSTAAKFSRRARCQPGPCSRYHDFIGRLVAAQIHRRRRALEHVQLLRVFADERHALNGRCTGADDRNALVGELRQPAVVVAAGVVVIPARRVERVPFEIGDAGNARQLRPVRGSGRLNDELRADAVVAIRRHLPAARVVEPFHLGDARLEDRVVVQTEVLTDALRVLVDLRRERVFLLRHVARFFEQRQVAVRLDVALRARIAVPIPRAAEIAARLDDAEVRDAAFLEARTGHQAAETGADHRHVDVEVERLALESGSTYGSSSA